MLNKYKNLKTITENEMKKLKGGVVSPDCPTCDTLKDCLRGYKCMKNEDDGCYTCHRDLE